MLNTSRCLSGSLASGGYTFYWKRTDIDAEWSQADCTTNSIYLQCVPGAAYAWKVKAFFVGLVSLLDFIKGEFLVALDAGKYIGML